MVRMRRGRQNTLLVGAISVALAISAAPPARAEPLPVEPLTTCRTGTSPGGPLDGYRIFKPANARTTEKFQNFDYGPAWERSGKYPAILTISTSVTYQSTWSATVSIGVKAVSAEVGFTFENKQKVLTSASYPIQTNDHQIYFVKGGTTDRIVTFEIHEYCGHQPWELAGARHLGKIGDGTAHERGSTTSQFCREDKCRARIPS